MNQLENVNPIARAFIEGGFVMYVILVIAVVTVILVVERFMALRSLRVDKKEFTDHIFKMIINGDMRQAVSFCDTKSTPLSNTVKAGLVQVMNKRPDEEVQVAMDAAVLREMPKLEGFTSFLAVLGNIAVLAGLLGTIIGMIGSFRGVAMADPATKAQLLSQGISHALNCTGFGLTVAIVAIVFYGLFQHMIQKAENEMLETSMSLLNLVSANRDKLRD
ncbi:MotA/TolQ/ExbB proton channel family protein [Pseudobdellovibrio exovorus]|uniref:Adventurous gliding motility protein R n=1 Tax=Pseudobdellovibrio exovorus JSS TaxID=1184267 RepID=M4V6F1_9BACT|nr:MotA/TolQ/ExbB proton channel family protein [Pseudobdellovibrio exovorus]AGH94952.1 adventurous gliding motility protein R [Pseudobdellovibrio exovorus JSS]